MEGAAADVGAAVLTADEWNRDYPPGTQVAVTLANGDVLTTRTASEAQRIGQHDMVLLEGRVGYWMLGWCRALEPPSR